ncbi:MAG: hypothetical protein AABY84_03630 [Candidatus Firestonebacteria bacterium]
MKTAIAYILTVLGLPVVTATGIIFIFAIPFYSILQKLFGEKSKKWLILDFIIEAICGIFMIWFTIILWTWLKVEPSILIPILLVIPIIVSSGRAGYNLTQWFGLIAGIIIGYIFLL